MKTKSINPFNVQDDLQLSKQQMKAVKGGDDDVLFNNSNNVGQLSFNG
jgi:hypothetical protein